MEWDLLELALRTKHRGLLLVVTDSPADTAAKLKEVAGSAATVDFADRPESQRASDFVLSFSDDPAAVMIVYDLEYSYPELSCLVDAIRDLNLARESLFATRKLMVFLASHSLAALFKKHARDLLAWMSQRFRLPSLTSWTARLSLDFPISWNPEPTVARRKWFMDTLALFQNALAAFDRDGQTSEEHKVTRFLRPMSNLYDESDLPSLERIEVNQQWLHHAEAHLTPAEVGRIHVRLGDAYRAAPEPCARKRREAALSHYEGALAVLTASEHPDDWADIQHKIGVLYFETSADGSSDLAETIRRADEARRRRRRRIQPSAWAESAMLAAAALLRLGERYNRARRLLNMVLAGGSLSAMVQARAELWKGLLHSRHSTSELDRTRNSNRCFSSARAVFSAEGADGYAAMSYYYQGLVQYRAWQKAVEYLESSKSYFTAEERPLQWATLEAQTGVALAMAASRLADVRRADASQQVKELRMGAIERFDHALRVLRSSPHSADPSRVQELIDETLHWRLMTEEFLERERTVPAAPPRA